MSEETHPIVDLKQEDLDAMLKKALRITLILGVLGSIIMWIGGGWRNAAMLATGTAISAASIWEWKRLVDAFNARMEKRKTPGGTGIALVFIVLRLTIFAGVIYGSLKCFHGSVAALLCGLCLAVLTIGWETIQLMKN
jgi:hypothetical protein